MWMASSAHIRIASIGNSGRTVLQLQRREADEILSDIRVGLSTSRAEQGSATMSYCGILIVESRIVFWQHFDITGLPGLPDRARTQDQLASDLQAATVQRAKLVAVREADSMIAAKYMADYQADLPIRFPACCAAFRFHMAPRLRSAGNSAAPPHCCAGVRAANAADTVGDWPRASSAGGSG